MLILSRKPGEELILDGDIRVRVAKINGSRVTLAIDPPSDRRIMRGELLDEVKAIAPSEVRPAESSVAWTAPHVSCEHLASAL